MDFGVMDSIAVIYKDGKEYKVPFSRDSVKWYIFAKSEGRITKPTQEQIEAYVARRFLIKENDKSR